MTTTVDRHVVLVGLMSTGKSTIGRPLADALDRELSDNDAWLEAETGRTARAIEESDGKEAVNALELRHLAQALDRSDPLVICAAASTILDPGARERLAGPGCFTVWLNAPPAWLARRVAKKDHRPLPDGDILAALEEMYEERRPLYADAADLVVDVDTLSDRATDGPPLVLEALHDAERTSG